MFKNLANKLTLSRIIVIPVILAFMLVPLVIPFVWAARWAAWIALLLYTYACVTDWLDGYLARRNNTITKVGQFLDPIADKLLVAAIILVLVYSKQSTILNTLLILLPALVILMREITVSGLREFLANTEVSVPVSRLAKWKTAIQMVALGFLIIGDYAPYGIPATIIGIIGLWIAAIFTIITAWDYWKASVKHF
ncbi:MAG: CDP-diacylglycerol--glycerol-3-phosphate 3-phosphatidyltransferase [Alphaproteobacteria bacterium]|nr:CDP-diacylglycerol--glycerol-3-phosphate 3-phosphatidyltransferase [Alphaproteobacteria bacterium]